MNELLNKFSIFTRRFRLNFPLLHDVDIVEYHLTMYLDVPNEIIFKPVFLKHFGTGDKIMIARKLVRDLLSSGL